MLQYRCQLKSDTGFFVFGCGKENKDLNLLKIAQNVGPPTRANCGACHWYGGGGDAVKHGDFDSTLKDPPYSDDVHMGGQDFPCQVGFARQTFESLEVSVPIRSEIYNFFRYSL